mgnify:CR=1 FL=1
MSSLAEKPKVSPFSRNHLLRDASWQAVYDAMKTNPALHVFGEGAEVKARFDAPAMLADFPDRVHTMPISEDGNINFVVGAALMGVTPIYDVISCDFLFRAMDSIVNTAAKLDGKTDDIRADTLIGGPTTGQRPEAMFAHVPGLNVVIPSTPHDAYGLMASALMEPGVTLYIEDRMIEDSGPWLDGDLRTGEAVSLGSIGVRRLTMRSSMRKVPLVTVITYGVMRQRAERLLAPWLESWDGDYMVEPNLSVDLLDMRSLYPLDRNDLGKMLQRTRKLLIIEPDVVHGGVGAEIAAWVAEEMPDVRVKRIGAPRRVIPAAPADHHLMLPSEEEIRDALINF